MNLYLVHHPYMKFILQAVKNKNKDLSNFKRKRASFKEKKF